MDDDELDTPNCPACLTRMEPAELGSTVFWQCQECGLTRIA
jgi:tRNA(Ile2) C34 agmatinyltransferase TiaS